MGIGHGGAKAHGARQARVFQGPCRICHENIWPGQFYYSGVGGTNTIVQGKAHKVCYDPTPNRG